MMKLMLLVGIVITGQIFSGEKMLYNYSGQITDKTAGWSFEASKPQNGVTYNKFEGYYPDKGGKLISPVIKLDKKENDGEFYSVQFVAQASERAYQGVLFYDKAGSLLPDNYDVVYPGSKQSYRRIIYAMPGADHIRVFFQSTSGIQAWDLSVQSATLEEAAQYCDHVYAKMPVLSFSPPENAMKMLPRTADALHSGKPWRIVMLGDSIVQDTFNSQFQALIKREFPNSNVSYIASIRGSTGCWYYCLANHFVEYVIKHKPDLLVIGGISNFNQKTPPTGTKAIEIVAKAAMESLGCEVLLLSSTLSIDTREHGKSASGRPIAPREFDASYAKFNSSRNDMDGLAIIAKQNGFAFWDMTTPAYRWLYSSGKSYGFYSRDEYHSGELGKQIIGRILVEYFKTAK